MQILTSVKLALCSRRSQLGPESECEPHAMSRSLRVTTADQLETIALKRTSVAIVDSNGVQLRSERNFRVPTICRLAVNRRIPVILSQEPEDYLSLKE